MSKLKLYQELAEVYDQLYEKLFDYQQDAEFVDAIFKKYHTDELLELACGTGHLTSLLNNKGYQITAIDLYEEMLDIARKRLPDVKFFRQDMRCLNFDRKFKGIISLGRSFTYMTTNNDVENCLRSVCNHLANGGLFLFDNFNAAHFVRVMKEEQEFENEVKTSTGKIKRISTNKWHLKHGVTFEWSARYVVENGDKVDEYEDVSILRTFFKEEIEYFLELTGFEVLEFFEENAAFTVLARKK